MKALDYTENEKLCTRGFWGSGSTWRLPVLLLVMVLALVRRHTCSNIGEALRADGSVELFRREVVS